MTTLRIIIQNEADAISEKIDSVLYFDKLTMIQYGDFKARIKELCFEFQDKASIEKYKYEKDHHEKELKQINEELEKLEKDA